MSTFGKRSLQSLTLIYPPLVRVLTEAIKDTPIDFTITDGVRTVAVQASLYAKGRTRLNEDTGPLPGKPLGATVTNADGVRNKSNHQMHDDGYGHAVDLYPYVNGAIDYDDRANRLHAIADHIKATAKRIGVAGLIWGGDWTVKEQGIVDRPHFQIK